MPKFKGSCGCYNREIARMVGIIPAIVLNDLEDKYDYYQREGGLVDGYFYLSQANRADALVISRQNYGAALKTLEENGLIKKKIGYRPGTQTKTTWVMVTEYEIEENDEGVTISLPGFRQSDCQDSDNLYYNDTKKPDSRQNVTPSGAHNGQVEEKKEPRIVFLKVNPTGRQWKSKRTFTTQEMVDEVESHSGEDIIDYCYWMSPGMVGSEKGKKILTTKVKLIQPDVLEDNEVVTEEGKKKKTVVIKGGICY